MENTYDMIYNVLTNARNNASGATLEDFQPVHYSAGFQYSTTPNSAENMTPDIEEAVEMVAALGGNCGVWYDGGFFYVETSFRAADVETALMWAAMYDQRSIYDWKRDAYIDVTTGNYYN